jgi:hypothetical protein
MQAGCALPFSILLREIKDQYRDAPDAPNGFVLMTSAAVSQYFLATPSDANSGKPPGRRISDPESL